MMFLLQTSVFILLGKSSKQLGKLTIRVLKVKQSLH